ncbi:MAG: hypothetical protein ABH881_01340 [bacterium]
MLGKLFGSNARVKLLKFFLSNSDKKFYIRQISRDLKLQVNSVRRELENLEKLGLLTSSPEPITAEQGDGKKNKNKKVAEEKHDKKYYRVDPDFILFDEIKALMMKAHILYEKDFVENIQKAGKIKLLILTGIFINRADSGTDLLIVGVLNKDKLGVLIKGLEVDIGRELNYTVMSSSEFKYRRDITDVFLFEILDGRKMVVVDELGL